MKNLLIAFVIALTMTGMASAQDDYKKGELFLGYSNGQIDTGLGDLDDDIGIDLDERETFHGFNVSGVYNVSRYFGLKGDVSGVYNSRDFSFTVPGPTPSTVAFDTDNSLYNFLGGVQIKNNSNSGRLKPFAHALIGAAHSRTKVDAVACPIGVDCSDIVSGSETNFAGAFGGGLDLRVSNRFQIRLIQVDYNPIWFDGGAQNNIRFGFGIVF